MTKDKQAHDTRFGLLRRNKFFLFWCRFFVELNALNAIIQLFYLNRGLNVSQIFYLGIAWSLATIIFDVPTSMIADKWGRKKTIVLGVIINILGNLGMLFSYGFGQFFLTTFITSLSFSFFLGIEDAFLFDTLKEMKQEGVVLKTSGKYAIATRASKMFLPLFGVIIAGSLTVFRLNLLIGINILSTCIALVFALLLVEPRRYTKPSASQLSMLKDSWALLKRSAILRTFAFNKTLIFIASFVFWKYYQKPLTEMGVSILMLGVLYPIFNALTITIYAKSEFIFRTLNKRLIFEIPVWATLIASLIFVFSGIAWLSYISCIILIVAGNVRDPFFNQQVQWRLQSSNRSTSGSLLNILKSIFDIPILLLSGYLASFGDIALMSVPVVLSLITLIFFRIESRDILLKPASAKSD